MNEKTIGKGKRVKNEMKTKNRKKMRENKRKNRKMVERKRKYRERAMREKERCEKAEYEERKMVEKGKQIECKEREERSEPINVMQPGKNEREREMWKVMREECELRRNVRK